ncbi:Primosomal protein N' [subsurface metagenome]
MFVNVAINIPSAGLFTYGVPDGMEGQIAIGKRVLVPFGRRTVTGYIVESIPSTDVPSVKNIIDLLDAEPLFDAQDLAFYRWISEYYLYPLGKTLKTSLPGGIDVESSRWVCLSDNRQIEEVSLSGSQRRIIEILAEHPQGLSVNKLEKTAGRKSILADLRKLEALHCVQTENRIR